MIQLADVHIAVKQLWKESDANWLATNLQVCLFIIIICVLHVQC